MQLSDNNMEGSCQQVEESVKSRSHNILVIQATTAALLEDHRYFLQDKHTGKTYLVRSMVGIQDHSWSSDSKKESNPMAAMRYYINQWTTIPLISPLTCKQAIMWTHI